MSLTVAQDGSHDTNSGARLSPKDYLAIYEMALEDRNEADKLEMSQEEFSAIAVCPCVNDDMYRLRKGWATREPSLQVSELGQLSSNNQST